MSSRDGSKTPSLRWGIGSRSDTHAPVPTPVFGRGRVRLQPLVAPASAPLAPSRSIGASSISDSQPQSGQPRSDPEPKEAASPAAPMTAAAPVYSDVPGRKAPRRIAMIPALLTYDGFGNGMPCKILNMSVTGALVELPRPDQGWYDDIDTIPAEITLRLKIDRMERDGRIVRRVGREIGVRFTTAARPMKSASR